MGCLSTHNIGRAQPLTDRERLDEALQLIAMQQTDQALLCLLNLRDTTPDESIKKMAVQQCAKVFALMGNYTSAMNVLTPLPLLVQTEEDAVLNAMAAEYAMHLGPYTNAIPYLERALYNELPPTPTEWRAVAYFNYGLCAIALRMPEQAQMQFQAAFEIFQQRKDVLACQRCQSILKTLAPLCTLSKKK